MMRCIWAVLVAAMFLVCGPSGLQAQTLTWDANSETDIAGYRVFYGTKSGSYPNQVDVGKQTQYQPPQNFNWSQSWFFAVQAYNTSGVSSALSAELKWIPPAPPSLTSLVASTGYPLNAGQPVTWTATAAANTSPLEYRFYMYKKTAWVLAQDYGPSNTMTWIPSGSDAGNPYTVQVWARRVGSTAQFEASRTTPTFAVTGAALDLTADVDFPTPPGNEVTWTAHAPFSYTGTLEYKFLVANQNDGVFTVFRDYATGNSALWAAPANGSYAVQVMARHVGSGKASEFVGTALFDVSQTPLTVTQLSADVGSQTFTGTKVTWTARVKGGMAGPIQYQFWIYSPTKGWKLGQPYGSSDTFTWTPAWSDDGDHTVQVWVRNNGSAAQYEALRSSGWLKVERAAMTLTTSTLFPAAPGSQVDWTASVPDPSADLEYQFSVYSAASSSWTVARAYSTVPTFQWTPTATGAYSVMAWARQIGSPDDYEVFRGTEPLHITQGPAQIASVTSSASLPAAPGTTITWTAAGFGGTAGPLQYQFWRRSNGAWVLVQDYSSLSSYTWTTAAGDVGEHAIQVWVRSAGSTATFESAKSTGYFWIQ